jgi:uncharacterized protein YaiI (UPF0178 family)
MMPIDKFINQLIQLGLADSFLDVIEHHYLKVTKIYNSILEINEDNIISINLIHDAENDSITIILELVEAVDNLFISDDKELTVSLINNGNTVEITATNNYESEDEVYENRFNGRRTPYTHKWS